MSPFLLAYLRSVLLSLEKNSLACFLGLTSLSASLVYGHIDVQTSM